MVVYEETEPWQSGGMTFPLRRRIVQNQRSGATTGGRAARGHAPAVSFRQGVRVYDRVWNVKEGERKRKHGTGRDRFDVCFLLVARRNRCSTSRVSRLACLGLSFQR